MTDSTPELHEFHPPGTDPKTAQQAEDEALYAALFGGYAAPVGVDALKSGAAPTDPADDSDALHHRLFGDN